ncbi:MAG: uncharacterized protein A8A55_2819 [Amphiamblys sp. WSBS2006]|nr:MAG: uncharacterized protein A8A55_2819 [Amphiamblys sp. WSBS2006]
METGMIETLKLGNTFFVFTEKSLFLAPEREYNRIRHLRIKEYIFLKSKYLPETANRDTERVACIICLREDAPEDFVSPLCRDVHYVICKECMENDGREVFCPFCKEKESDNKAFREELIEKMKEELMKFIEKMSFSLMPHQTLSSIELRPEMEVETAVRLTRETKVVLDNVAVSYALFFRLIDMTSVTIRNKISLFGNRNSLGRCIEEFDWDEDWPTRVIVYGCSEEETEQIYSNLNKTDNRTSINPWNICGNSTDICTLLKHLTGTYREYNKILLELPDNGPTKKMFCEGSNNIWIGKVKKLKLKDCAVEIFLKLRIHEENVMEELSLEACHSKTLVDEIYHKTTRSIWIGRVKKLKLKDYAVEIFFKLRIHEENEMEELSLEACHSKTLVDEIYHKTTRSIWIGRVKKLKLKDYAVEIFFKLRIHEENEMEELSLEACHSKTLVDEIYHKTTRSIWIGKVKKLTLKDYAVGILPKLRIHEENEMEELSLEACHSETLIDEISKTRDRSIWIGKVRKINLTGYAEKIKDKLDFTLLAPDDQEEIGSD